MHLRVERKIYTTVSTISDLYINNNWFCFVLEDVIRVYPNKIKGQTAIWEGTYPVIIDYSTRFLQDMPHILLVPLFDSIRIHAGNTDKDTEGCLLVGNTIQPDTVLNSKITFEKFFPILKESLKTERCEIEIINK